MTKNEFNYWKENVDKIESSDVMYIHLFNPTTISVGIVDTNSENRKTTNPDIIYKDCEGDYFTTLTKKIISANIEGDELIITTRMKHDYVDKEKRSLELCIVGEPITNRFKRNNIKSLDVMHLTNF